MSYPLRSSYQQLQQVARLAMRRYAIPAPILQDALEEAQRSRAQGGLSHLGSILEQRRVICAGQALELNRVERELSTAPEAVARATREVTRVVRRLRPSLPHRHGESRTARWKQALDQAWEVVGPRFFTGDLAR